jgi:hypothetical protein
MCAMADNCIANGVAMNHGLSSSAHENGAKANRGHWSAFAFFVVFVIRSFYLIGIRRCKAPVVRWP